MDKKTLPNFGSEFFVYEGTDLGFFHCSLPFKRKSLKF